MSYDTNPLSQATPHDAGADIRDLCRQIDVLSAIVKNQNKIIDFLRKRAESAEAALAESERAGERLAGVLERCNNIAMAAASDFPGASEVHTVAIAALADWRARK